MLFMGRYLLILFVAFVLYWTLKAALRRFLAPPKRSRRRSVPAGGAKERVQHGTERTPGIDYSKIKDADYRDL
jgi:hypothetical protein